MVAEVNATERAVMRRSYRLSALAGIVVAFVVGSCSASTNIRRFNDGGTAPPIEGLRTLTIEPANTTLVLGATPVAVTYRAQGVFEDGNTRDVTNQVSFALKGLQDIGSFTGPVFTSIGSIGGERIVEARAGTARATARINLAASQSTNIAPASDATGVARTPVPTTASTLFAGTVEPSRAPRIVYPNDGVVLPPNLRSIEVHWLRGPESNTLFELSFKNDVSSFTAYARCSRPSGVQDDGCIVTIDGSFYRLLAFTNRGGSPLQIRVRATGETGGGVGVSAMTSVTFARDDVNGTIYYWTTSDGGRIMRYDYSAGATATEPQRVLGPEQVDRNRESRCVGCHAVSRDGKKILGSVGGIGSGGMLLYDLENSQVLRAATRESDKIIQFGSFSPLGDQLVGVYGDDTTRPAFGDLLLFDTRCDAANMATCGMVQGRIPMDGKEADHPDWSPDGSRIAYTEVGQHSSSQRPRHGAIMYVAKQGSGWGTAQTLVPRADGKNRYNPNFAPNSDFLVYNESTCPGGNIANEACDADVDPSSKMWIVGRDGGTPILLQRAVARGALDTRDDNAATFPRFAPFVFTLSETEFGSTQIVWVTFASTRRYGLRRTPDSTDSNPGGTWLWMAAVRTDALARGEDPSFAAFALPFQNLATSNHIAIWTTRSVGMVPPAIF